MNISENTSKPSPDELRKNLDTTHAALLRIHKALIDYEQVRYERKNGAIGGPNDVFNLLVRDPWFAWLRPMTSLIVEIDEYVSSKKPREVGDGVAILGQARALLTPAEHGGEFQRHYAEALQESAEVAGAHGEWKLALVQMG